jgi:hypothetical protein
LLVDAQLRREDFDAAAIATPKRIRDDRPAVEKREVLAAHREIAAVPDGIVADRRKNAGDAKGLAVVDAQPAGFSRECCRLSPFAKVPAKIAPPSSSESLSLFTMMSPPRPTAPSFTDAKMPVPKFVPSPSIRSFVAATSMLPPSPRSKVLAEI